MVSDIWLRTILIVRKETRCRHTGYSWRLTARVLLYAPSHRQDSTYNGLCYTSRGALAGTRNSSVGSPHEGSIRRPIAPWAIHGFDACISVVLSDSPVMWTYRWVYLGLLIPFTVVQRKRKILVEFLIRVVIEGFLNIRKGDNLPATVCRSYKLNNGHIYPEIKLT